MKKSAKFNRLLTILSYVISLVLFYWLFFIVLPSEIDISQVTETISVLSLLDNMMLLLAGSLTILTVGWTAATVLPGIKISKATQASVVSQLTAVVLPPPSDMVIRFGMYKSFGFAIDKSAIAVVLSGIARYFTVVALALIGLVAVTIAGEGSSTTTAWLIGGSAIFVLAIWLMKQILGGSKTAEYIGLKIQRIVNRALKLIHHKPYTNISKAFARFSVRTQYVVVDNVRRISISNLAWGLSCYLVLLIATRLCGIGPEVMSASYLLLITGLMLILNCLPIPGSGVGVTETLLLTNMTFPDSDIKNAFTAALVLYRIYTWLLPFPAGTVAYFVWRHQVATKAKSMNV